MTIERLTTDEMDVFVREFIAKGLKEVYNPELHIEINSSWLTYDPETGAVEYERIVQRDKAIELAATLIYTKR